MVYLGRHSLKKLYERGSQQETVSDIKVHPDWQRNSIEYDADIAILTLTNRIQFSMFVIPSCLPSLDDVLTHGTSGTIVNKTSYLIFS